MCFTKGQRQKLVLLQKMSFVIFLAFLFFFRIVLSAQFLQRLSVYSNYMSHIPLSNRYVNSRQRGIVESILQTVLALLMSSSNLFDLFSSRWQFLIEFLSRVEQQQSGRQQRVELEQAKLTIGRQPAPVVAAIGWGVQLAPGFAVFLGEFHCTGL